MKAEELVDGAEYEGIWYNGDKKRGLINRRMDPKLRPSRTIDEMRDASEMAASSGTAAPPTTGGGAT